VRAPPRGATRRPSDPRAALLEAPLVMADRGQQRCLQEHDLVAFRQPQGRIGSSRFMYEWGCAHGCAVPGVLPRGCEEHALSSDGRARRDRRCWCPRR